MKIKNYTSPVEASRSMAKIEELLVEIGATNINKQYLNKLCTGITFLLFNQQIQQTLQFHLKAQVEECLHILWKDVSAHARIQNPTCFTRPTKQPGKIFTDWTEIQCSMILLGQAKPLQMFSPFMYHMKTSKILFDKVAC